MISKDFLLQCAAHFIVWNPIASFCNSLLSYWSPSQKALANSVSWSFFLEVSDFSLRSLIYFDLSFIWDGRFGSSLIHQIWKSSPPSTIC